MIWLAGFLSREVKLSEFVKKRPSEEIIAAMQEKRRLHNIEIVRQSILNNLKKEGHYFFYEDIIRCAKEACWTTDWETRSIVNEALKQLGLTKEDFS